jgi:DNA-3-methyladenine glycosylase I
MKTYCEAVRGLPEDNVHRIHHDTEHGSMPESDDDIFRRLILEINQAGLSFDIVLKKKKTLYEAYPSIAKVAKYTQKDIKRLMNNSGIIRNRLKIEAAIYNAKKIQELQKEYGSLRKWLDINHPKTKDEWVKLFKKNFKFTGGEIINEFMMSICYLPGAHVKGCKLYINRLHK